MFITKEIMNKKHKKALLPHKKQILKEIKASQDDQDWKIDNFCDPPRPKSSYKRHKRPNTAINLKAQTRKSTTTIYRAKTQENEQQGGNYLKKVNYQFNQITKIANLFDNKFDFKQKSIREHSVLEEKITNIKRYIKKKEKEHKDQYEKMRRVTTSKALETEPNLYMGYSQQKVKKIIPVSRAKDQDMTMLSRYIKGGYVSQVQEYSQKQNKAEVIKLKKTFLTMKNLYDAVRGKRNEGIEHVKPESINRSTLENYVYYLENEKSMKLHDKLAIEKKIKLVS